MPFGLKGVPPTYQWVVVSMAFREYLEVFMKLFLDDFSVFNDVCIHLHKLWLCFDKCREFDISLNSEKCMFLVNSGVIFGYVGSKEGKLRDSKKIWTSWICLHRKHQKTYKSSMEWFNSINVSSRILFLLWPPSWSFYAKQRYLWTTKC